MASSLPAVLPRVADDPALDDAGVRWQHKLASRVVIQAFRDLRSPHSLEEHRITARLFLTDSPMLRYWCHVGALDLRRITRRARRMTGRPAVL